MSDKRVLYMDTLNPDQLAIEPEFICQAWVDAHYGHPSPHNPLTRGLFHLPHSPASSSASVAQPEFVPAGLTPPRRPRQFGDPASIDLNIHSHGSDADNGHEGGLGTPYKLMESTGGGASASCGRYGMPDKRASPGHTMGTDPVTEAVTAENPLSQTGDEGDQGSVNDASWDSSMRSDFTNCLIDASGPNQITMPPPAFRKKRKGGSLSPSKRSDGQASTNKPSSDTREKRLRLTDFSPPGIFGIPDVANYDPDDVSRMPAGIIRLLAVTFPIGDLEAGCFPITSEIEQILQTSFPHEPIPRHARFPVDSTSIDACGACELVEYAIDIHRACLQNSCNAEDEAAWYPIVRRLLSVSLPTASSAIARPPSHALARTKHDLFVTIDATTKSTCLDLSPAVTIKLDVLLAFNPQHPLLSHVLATGVRVNAFSDSSIRKAIVILGVEVKSGASGGLDAEYQVGVWGMKTLNLMRSLRMSTTGSGDYVIGLSVCAHVWSFHVTYWRGDGIVTHGPVCLGSTDSLYGTMKIVAFVRRFKEWARDIVLPDWLALVGIAAAKEKDGELRSE
ncbi:hypothetical protein Q9L58_001450 [Maublancomyces gigas]|uniref:PD-(D/E)XK nuclease-like domain-containing protein n=1 Tax=Discina gigas TaxID=1032678 RepID=A0ABR3GU14_9PEZI